MTTENLEKTEAHRAAFEAWMADQGLESKWQPERNAYSHFAAHFAWRAWCAALDSVEIELPEEAIEYHYFAGDIVEAIEAAGVRFK